MRLIFLAAIACPLHPAAAVGPQTTRFAGIVQTIDYKDRKLTFKPDARGNSFSVGWIWATAFYADGKRVKADALKVGMQVRVKYLSPLFGREYATAIEWDSSTVRPPG